MSFYLGRTIKTMRASRGEFYLPATDLMTHAFICGSTGSGKTVLGKILVEEALRNNIPAIVVDLKGDLASMAVPLMDLSPDELSPWIDAPDEDSRLQLARQIVSDIQKGHQTSGYTLEQVQNFRRRLDAKLFTPRSSHGTPVSISLLAPPEGIISLFDDEPETAIAAVKNAANAIFDRLYSKNTTDDSQRLLEMCLLEEMISLMWKNEHNARGVKAINELVKMIIEPPVPRIGAMETDQFMPPEMRLSLARRINALALGSERLWYEGISLDELVRDTLNNKGDGTTRLSILYLGGLDSFSDRSLVISQLGYAVHSALRLKPGAQTPRIMLYIDEIGGEGNEAFYPSEPYESLSKPAISLLVRQGRAYGCCCILATQNPADIDYRGLSNCQTWFVGRLQTAQDRELIMQGISKAQLFIDKIDAFLRSAESGQFAVKLRTGTVEQFQERWLLSYHGVIPAIMLPRISRAFEDRKGYFEARSLADQGRIKEATEAFDRLIQESPEDGRFWLGKGSALLADSQYEDAISCLEKACIFLPDDPKAFTLLGRACLLADYMDKAISALEKGAELQSQDEQLYLDLGEALYKSGLTEKSDQYLSKAVDLNMSLLPAWHLRGVLAYESGAYQQAENFFSKALDLGAGFDTHFCRASSLLASGKAADAVPAFEKALELCLDSASALFGIALALRGVDRNDEAIDKLQKLIAIVPNDPGARCTLAEIMLSRNQADDAVEILEPLSDSSPDDIDIATLLGKALLLSGQSAKSITHFKHALAQNKKSDDLWVMISNAFLNLGKYPDAETGARNATRLAPSNPDAWLALARVNMAMFRSSGGDKAAEILNNAFSHYLKAGELNSNLSEAWYGAGMVLEKLDKQYEASDYYRRALEAEPGHLDARERKGVIALLMDRPDLALQSFRIVRKSDSARISAWLGEADALKALRQIDEALELLHKACDSFPDNPDVWRHMGIFFKEIKDDDKASHCLEKANELRERSQSINTSASCREMSDK